MHRSKVYVLSGARRGAVTISELAYDEGSVLAEHRHPHGYVSVLLEGAYTELRDGLPRYCAAGTALFHPPGEVHADCFLARGRCLNFAILGDDAGAHTELLDAVRAMHPELERAVHAALPAPAASAARSEPAWLAGVLRDFAWTEPVPLSAASALAGTHPTHFARAFHHHVGVTPSVFRRRERVRAVSRLLLESSAPLSSIAQECGFSDQSHLTNVFRATTGISPKRYRGAFAR